MPALPAGITLGPASATRGRSIVAARVFSPGDAIATFTGPSVAIPDSPHLAQTCSYCLAVAPDAEAGNGTRVDVCTGCRTVCYCSKACQKADWALAHGRGECKAFRRVRSHLQEAQSGGAMVLPTPVRALVQMLLRPEMQAAAAEMEGHVELIRAGDPATWSDMELQARAALRYMGREASPDTVGEAVVVLCKLQVNSFNRLDVDSDESGIYINPALAMVNHSCVPNAFVQFVGRNAVLHAYQEIKESEEIEISYIESTLLHRSQRQHALRTRYHFDCVCPRCKDDLDVYQVCQMYPHLELNTFSLVPDLHKTREHPAKYPLHSNKPLQQNIEEVYPSCSTSLQGLHLAEKYRTLQQRWKACAQLRKAELYAIEPLTQVLVEANIYFSERGNFQYSLAISCFLALNCHPYQKPMPFSGPRMKGMLMVAKLLAAVPPSPASSASSGDLSTRISQAMDGMDQATMCQIVLAMVVHYGQAAHSKEWQVYRQARELLDDVESLPGRETENALINAFIRNPNGSEERRFFKTAVLDPIQTLSDFALEIMDTEFNI